MARRLLGAALAFAVTVTMVLINPQAAPAGGLSQPRLINADDATENYQFHVAMLYKDPGTRPKPVRCSGALIRPQWIITAAHCVLGLGEDPANFWFSVGSNDYRRGTMMEAAEFIPHPEYVTGSTEFADIALVRLKTPATGPAISVLPPPDDRGSAVRMIGWGWTIDGDGASIPDVVRQLDTQLQPLQNCYFGDPFDATDGDLCVRRAKDNTAGACNGDSGSPLLYRINNRWYVIGVDSRSGGETGCLNTDEVYVSTWYHWTWISRTLNRFPPS